MDNDTNETKYDPPKKGTGLVRKRKEKGEKKKAAPAEAETQGKTWKRRKQKKEKRFCFRGMMAKVTKRVKTNPCACVNKPRAAIIKKTYAVARHQPTDCAIKTALFLEQRPPPPCPSDSDRPDLPTT